MRDREMVGVHYAWRGELFFAPFSQEYFDAGLCQCGKRVERLHLCKECRWNQLGYVPPYVSRKPRPRSAAQIADEWRRP